VAGARLASNSPSLSSLTETEYEETLEQRAPGKRYLQGGALGKIRRDAQCLIADADTSKFWISLYKAKGNM
jgi:hypothetical protein